MFEQRLSQPVIALPYPSSELRASIEAALLVEGHESAQLIRDMRLSSDIHDLFVSEVYGRLLALIRDHAVVSMYVGGAIIALFRDAEDGWMFTLHVSSTGMQLSRHPLEAGFLTLRPLQPAPYGSDFLAQLPGEVQRAVLGMLGHPVQVQDYVGGGHQVRLDAPAITEEVLDSLQAWTMDHARHNLAVVRAGYGGSAHPLNRRFSFTSQDAVLSMEVRDYVVEVKDRPYLKVRRDWHHRAVELTWNHFSRRHPVENFFTII